MLKQMNTGQNNLFQYLMVYLKKIFNIRVCDYKYLYKIRIMYLAIFLVFLFVIPLAYLVAGTDDRNRIEKLSKPDYEFINSLKLDKIYKSIGKEY